MRQEIKGEYITFLITKWIWMNWAWWHRPDLDNKEQETEKGIWTCLRLQGDKLPEADFIFIAQYQGREKAGQTGHTAHKCKALQISVPQRPPGHLFPFPCIHFLFMCKWFANLGQIHLILWINLGFQCQVYDELEMLFIGYEPLRAEFALFSGKATEETVVIKWQKWVTWVTAMA